MIELLQILSGQAGAWCEWMVDTKSRSKGLAVALLLLEVEFRLEEGSQLEVEFMKELCSMHWRCAW
jgi:hypothetical protein